MRGDYTVEKERKIYYTQEISPNRVEEVDCRRMAIYGPMLYTAPYVMLLIQADTHTLRGQLGGRWALEIKTFLGPVQWHRAFRRVPFGAQKSRDFQGPSYLPK